MQNSFFIDFLKVNMHQIDCNVEGAQIFEWLVLGDSTHQENSKMGLTTLSTPSG